MDDETFEQLRALMRLAREHRLYELSVESADGSVRLRRRRRRAAAPCAPQAATPDTRVGEIRAPLLGVFYRAPSPEAPPYLEAGDWVQPGQIVGLIEAMKVFNEITSEIEGRVAAVAARDGELVQAGQVLMVVEPA